MNIIFVTTLYPSSKDQTLVEVPYTLHYFVENWIREGHKVTVLKVESTYPKYIPIYNEKNKGRFERQTSIDGVPVYILPIKKNINRKYSKRHINNTSKSALEFVEKNKIECDIVVFHVVEPSFYISISLKEYFNVPLVAGIHQTDINWISEKGNQGFFYKEKNNIDGYVFRSHALQKAFSPFIDNNKLGFIATSGVKMKSMASQDKLNQKKKKVSSRFIVVSNLIERKNIKSVITAFKKVKTTHALTSLKIIGDGVDKKKLELYTEEINMESHIEFLGYQDRETVFKELEEA